jgi:4,4'-diaponeurosporenoate glycosyltransferase
VALVVAWLTLLVQAAVAPPRALFDGGLVPALVLYAAVVVQVWWMVRQVGRFGLRTALAFPALLVVFLAVFARSAWATARGRVSWRGRELPARRR